MSFPKYVKDGLEWPEYVIDSTGTELDGAEPSAGEYPAYAIFRELALLGRAGAPGEAARVNNADLLAYADGEDQDAAKVYYDLGLPDFYSGPVYVETKGPLGTTGATFALRFPDSVSTLGAYGDRGLQRDGLLLVARQKAIRYSCSPALYRLAESVDRYNAASQTARTRDDCLLDIARIKKAAALAGARCDAVLDSEKIVEAGPVTLQLEDHGDSVSVVPDVPVEGLPSSSFIQKFDKRLSVDPVYNFDTEGGGRTRVVLSEAQRKAFRVIKKDLQHIRDPEKLRKLWQNPPSEFDDIDINVEALYSERVKGLGIYRPKVTPFICPYETEWLPGFEIDGVEGKKKLFVRTPDDLAELEQKIRSAQAAGSDFVDIKDERIDLETAMKTAELAAARQNGSGGSPKDAAEKYKVLIIDENIDELEYAELMDGLVIDEPEIPIIGMDPSFVVKKHQKEGISRLAALYDAKYPGVILADDMGLGKTFQALAFLEHLGQSEKGVLACIVAPVGLIGNWIEEHRRCFPEGSLFLKSLMGDLPRIREIREHPERFRNRVFLMSYDSMRRNQLEVCAVPWNVVMLDEAQKIKTPGTLVTNAAKALKADFKVALTGTPVENTFHDLWCIADFALPGFLGSAKDFASTYNPKPDDPDDEIARMGEELRKKLGKCFIRRIKEDVLSDLPPKYASDIPDHADKFKRAETIRLMPAEQKSAYDGVIADYRRRKDQEDSIGKRGILDVLHKLKSACEHPGFVIGNSDSKVIFRIDDSAKTLSLLAILDKVRSAGEKAIVFAEYRRTQRYLATIIHEHFGIKPMIVNGETPVGFDAEAAAGTRLGIVKAFNQKSGFDVVIMSPVAAGVGLTVTGANHVIHFSRHWNPSKEDQATDRAYRIGQTRPVYVYYLIARHPNERVTSFDDNLARLLATKRNVRGAILFPSARMEVKPGEFFDDSLGSD